MNIDANNPVVKLCAQGIQAEMAGDATEASKLYLQAWDIRSNDFEACIAAHYVARLQSTHEDALHWNIAALKHADMSEEENAKAFYPSLYLNVGKSYEDIGNVDEAKKHYELGLHQVNILPDDRLGNLTKDALKRGMERIS